jgi:ketol-acid reductoisomerase
MYRAVSDTAKYGGMTIGPLIVDDHVEENMRLALKAVQDGSFAESWIEEGKRGRTKLNQLMAKCESLEIEKVGKEVRSISGIQE